MSPSFKTLKTQEKVMLCTSSLEKQALKRANFTICDVNILSRAPDHGNNRQNVIQNATDQTAPRRYDMDKPDTLEKRVKLLIRLSLAAGLLGIAVGFYFNGVRGQDTAAFDVFAFAVRGILIGLAFWYFELFWVRGPRGRRLRARPYGTRLMVKVIAYVVLIEAAFVLGQAIFDPKTALDWVTNFAGV